MKILFIGGTGRLSKDVAKLAVDLGNEVYLFTRGTNSRSMFIDERYHMLFCDIKETQNAKKLIEGLYFDVVIDFLSYNVEQIKNTIEIIENKYKQYIFISSAAVYKRKKDQIISEEKTEIGNNKWSYAYSKFQCEKYLNEYYKGKTEKYTIIRPAVTYGNTRIPYPIVPQDTQKEYTFLYRIYHGQPIPVFDDGHIITNLTNTKDFAKAVVGLFGNDKAYGEAFHTTTDERVKIIDVLSILEEITGKKINRLNVSQEEIYKAMPYYKSILVGDKGESSIYDNSKIRNAVPGLSFDISLKDGLKEMVEFYGKTPQLQIIDYKWMGSIDRLAAKKGVKVKPEKNIKLKDRMKYLSGKYIILDKIEKILRKLKSFVKR